MAICKIMSEQMNHGLGNVSTKFIHIKTTKVGSYADTQTCVVMMCRTGATLRLAPVSFSSASLVQTQALP